MNHLKLLYFADVEPGGLSQYAVHQIAALRECGTKVSTLGLAHLQEPLLEKSPDTPFIKLHDITRSGNKWVRGIQAVLRKRWQLKQLTNLVLRNGYNSVLISSYSEYFSPFWYKIFERLDRKKVQFGVIVHDPIRDFRIGPKWWHELSVKLAYSCISHAFVHHDIVPEGFDATTKTLTVIPHGIYEAKLPNNFDSTEFRNKLKIPAAANVWLSFGHIRDSKNLQLAIAALPHFPNAFLLVVGKEQSSSQRSVEYYQREAARLGVAERCRWINSFVPDNEIGCYFSVSDLVLLLYSGNFRSASGVLNTVAPFSKPVLASCGDGPLLDAVKTFQLGVAVLPDSLDEILRGLLILRQSKLSPNWYGYRMRNNWMTNAQFIVDRFEESCI